MLISILILTPFIASLIVYTFKNAASQKLAFVFSILEFILSMIMFVVFKQNPEHPLLSINYPWINSLGIHINANINAISLLMVLLTTGLVPLIILTSFNTKYKNPFTFYSLILFMQMALIGVFTANDGFLFYIFWELALLPIFFICLLWGKQDSVRITFKFFVYTILGSLFMLVGLIYLYNQAPDGIEKSWLITDLYQVGKTLNIHQQTFVFITIFLAFAIKIPIFPFHSWQPDLYVNAPTPGTMLLSGIMLKMGTFGLIKWLLPITPLALEKWGTYIIFISIVGAIFASCIAIVQKDFKRLIAYSSIAHVAIISAGILTANQQGVQGGLVQMISHGVIAVGLFLVSNILKRNTGTTEISELGGIKNVNRTFTIFFFIILLGSIALPLTSGFVGEFLIFVGIYQHHAVIAVIAASTIILGAVYMLRTYQTMMLGEVNALTQSFTSLMKTDKIVLLIICSIIILIGFYPQPINSLAQQGAESIIKLIHP